YLNGSAWAAAGARSSPPTATPCSPAGRAREPPCSLAPTDSLRSTPTPRSDADDHTAARLFRAPAGRGRPRGRRRDRQGAGAPAADAGDDRVRELRAP